MKEQGSGKLTNLPTVTQGVRAKPEVESRTVWLQDPCSFCTGFCVVHTGSSQVSTCSLAPLVSPLLCQLMNISEDTAGCVLCQSLALFWATDFVPKELHLWKHSFFFIIKQKFSDCKSNRDLGEFLATWTEQRTLCWSDRTMSVIWWVIKKS